MMEEANRFVHIVEQEDDRVLRNIRGVLRENEEKKTRRGKMDLWTGCDGGCARTGSGSGSLGK